jgi:hypothetical protein
MLVNMLSIDNPIKSLFQQPSNGFRYTPYLPLYFFRDGRRLLPPSMELISNKDLVLKVGSISYMPSHSIYFLRSNIKKHLNSRKLALKSYNTWQLFKSDLVLTIFNKISLFLAGAVPMHLIQLKLNDFTFHKNNN